MLLDLSAYYLAAPLDGRDEEMTLCFKCGIKAAMMDRKIETVIVSKEEAFQMKCDDCGNYITLKGGDEEDWKYQ